VTSSFAVPVYQRKAGSSVYLTTLGVGPFTKTCSGAGVRKADEKLLNALKKAVAEASPVDLPRLDLKRGIRLHRVRLELVLKDAGKRKISGIFPVVVEPRDAGGERRLHLAYHPERQGEWFPADPDEHLGERAAVFFAGAWAALTDGELAALASDGKDSLRIVSFSAHTRTLLDELPDRKRDAWDDLALDPSKKKKHGPAVMLVLPKIGTNVTAEVAGRKSADLGIVRKAYRDELVALLGGPSKRSTLVVGPAGAGKSMLVRQAIADIVELDGYPVHRNLDRVTSFYRVSGRHLIAGMSRAGDWEQRCVELASDVRDRRIVLLVPDVHHFARIGRSRDSDRALSDFFRGPVARGEMAMVGECTPEQLRRLEDEDAAFAAAFARVHVAPATADETFRMMLAHAREIEVGGRIEIDPASYETILEVGGALSSLRALPGNAVDLLKRIADSASVPGSAADAASTKIVVGPDEVLEHLSRETGLPTALLSPDEPLTFEQAKSEIGARIFGQDRAVTEVADLALRIRSGLTDPSRPYAVYLFTGPTGTGKTELAKVLASYLYGSPDRLVRFDMSELSGPDAVARLVGDAWEPEGLLVRAGIAQPFSVILLDEIEKAHPRVLYLLLQVFGDGRLTDAAGNTADYRHAVLVMTSNLGARRQAPVGFDESRDGAENEVARAVRDFFPPELFNRIDAVVPFAPLTPEAAAFVTEKELAKLFLRPGLAERDVFVQVGEGAVARIAEHAMVAADGARSLKKFLDDRVGSLLVEHIAKAPGALSIVKIDHDGAEGLRVESQALVEAKPAAMRFPLLERLDDPLEALLDRVPAALQALDRLAASAGVARLSERLAHHVREHRDGKRDYGEPLYNLDRVRASLDELRARLEQLAPSSRDVAHDELERALEPERTSFARWYDRERWQRSRIEAGGGLRQRKAAEVGRGLRWEVFSCLAEVHVLARAIDKVEDPDQNAVFIDLAPLGKAGFLLGWMGRAYARSRGELDAVAWTFEGDIHDGGPLALEKALQDRAARVVLRIVGPCVRDFFELESGTHVFRPYARQPEVLQVSVVPARVAPSARALLAHPPPGDAGLPSRPLPIVRTLAFDPPLPSRPPALFAVEDYVLGISHETRVRDPLEALLPLWLARMTREDA
jgi:ATP-dependent Clp protease ATP-binding subunit ClpA/ATP-dependent Clp protease ATP-binding subunit ClpC